MALQIIFMYLSVAVSVVAIVLSYFCEDLFYFTLHQQLKLTEGSRAVKLWSEPPVEQFMSFYFFNWTNPEEFGEKAPKFVELGPFKYRMIQKKVNVVFNDNETLSYNVQRFWYFDLEGSSGSDAQNITSLNPILTSAAHVLRYSGYLRQKAFALAVNAYRVKHFITKPARQFVFDGISDPLLSTASYFQSFTSIDVPFDKFGVFTDRNGTYYLEGTYNIGSGIRDLSDVTKIHKWDWGLKTPYYDGDCGLVKGSTGELFPQRLTKADVLEFFLPDFCRSVTLYFKEETEVEGILGYKFLADSRVLDNGTIEESNKCFCSGECSPIGVLNVTTCRFGAPGFTSFPHFLYGDSCYLNDVEGLKPDAQKHEFYVTVEPNTGITLDAAMRLQANFLTAPHKYVKLLANAPKIYFPLVWTEARAIIPRQLALELQLGLVFLNYGSAALLSVAIIGSIPAILILMRSALERYRTRISKDCPKLNCPNFAELPLLGQKS